MRICGVCIMGRTINEISILQRLGVVMTHMKEPKEKYPEPSLCINTIKKTNAIGTKKQIFIFINVY